jgi:hypothetical protein
MTLQLTPQDMYAFRTMTLLSVPKTVMDVIGSMQLAPVSQTYVKKTGNFKKIGAKADRDPAWRRAAFLQLKVTEFKKDDPDYEACVSIVNKVAMSTIGDQTAIIRSIVEKRDEMFRIRVVNLLFNQGVSMPFFSKMMANMFELLHSGVPAIKEDLHENCSVEVFEKMFNLDETVVFPSVDDPKFDDLVVAWNKKKELRRGFGLFTTELHLRGLVDEPVILSAINTTLSDLDEMIATPALDKHIAESADQLVTFLFDASKALVGRFGKTHLIHQTISKRAKEIYATPKTATPCLGMRSRFKLDDLSKL